VVRGLEDGRTRWLVLAGVCVGLGFEAKMGAALLAVPGLVAAWLWVAPRGRVAALRQLLAGGAAMVVVGAAWPLLVWLTPAADRPWISGTADNSIWSLIFGYNGLGRISGQAGGPGGLAGGPGGGGGPGGNVFGGPTGPFRLLEQSLGGQAGWLLGFAVVGLIGLVAASRLRRTDSRTGWLIATGGIFLACGVTFSVASGIFHPYYVSLMAPFTAALCGAVAGQLLKGGEWSRIVGPLAIAAGVVCELVVLRNEGNVLPWLRPILIVGGLAAALALAFHGSRRLRIAALVAGLGLLLVAPSAWAAQTLGHATGGTFPAGGPAKASSFGGPGGGGGLRRFQGAGSAQGGFAPGGPAPGGAGGSSAGGSSSGGSPGTGSSTFGFRGGFGGGGGPFGSNAELTPALRYAQSHGGGSVAVSSQQGASQSIIRSGSDVVALGGFSGRESEVTVSWLADAVHAGKVRWVLVGNQTGGGLPGDNRVGSSELMAAVKKVGRNATSYGLYDLSGRADALAALVK
jgi:hypothetical protein